MSDKPWTVPAGFWTQIATNVKLDESVCEVWHGNEIVGEVRRDGSTYSMVIYPAPGGAFWTLPVTDLTQVIEFARTQLAKTFKIEPNE